MRIRINGQRNWNGRVLLMDTAASFQQVFGNVWIRNAIHTVSGRTSPLPIKLNRTSEAPSRNNDPCRDNPVWTREGGYASLEPHELVVGIHIPVPSLIAGV